MMNTLFIIRGVSGCGKSTTANLIVGEENVCTADEYFYINGHGVYAFEFSKLALAHKYCKDKLERLMSEGVEKVAVANTSTRERDVEEYMEVAEKYGYRCVVLVVENRHGGESLHDVPEKSLEKMENQLRNSIKLR
jgi:predicted kinase